MTGITVSPPYPAGPPPSQPRPAHVTTDQRWVANKHPLDPATVHAIANPAGTHVVADSCPEPIRDRVLSKLNTAGYTAAAIRFPVAVVYREDTDTVTAVRTSRMLWLTGSEGYTYLGRAR